MSLRIPYDPTLEDKVRLGYSHACQACYSLWALTSPDARDWQVEWIAEMSSVLPGLLLEEIHDFASNQGDYWMMPSSLFEEFSCRPFALEIARVRALSGKDIQSKLVAEYEVYKPLRESEKNALAAVQDNAASWRDQVLDLLEAYEPHFAPFWRLLQKVFTNELIRVQRLRQQGIKLYDLLPRLEPRFGWDSARSYLIVPSETVERFEVIDVDEFGISPHAFGMPLSWTVFNASDRKAGIYYEISDAWKSRSPGNSASDLVGRLHAVADETRLSVIRALVTRAQSTSDLAESLELAERSVASHLKVLEGVGLIHRTGNDKYAKFEADVAKCGSVITDLEQSLLAGVVYWLRVA